MQERIADYFKTQPVLKAWLFGSFARGEETAESDVDILIILDHSQPVGLKFFGMYEDLKELLGRPVDLVVDRSLIRITCYPCIGGADFSLWYIKR